VIIAATMLVLVVVYRAAVAQWGRGSFLSLALALLDELCDLPLPWLPLLSYRAYPSAHPPAHPLRSGSPSIA
jgi:hypothetical protein